MITTTDTYYYGHGEAFMGDAVAGGLPQSYSDHVSQIDSLEVTLTTEFIEHVSKRSSIAKKDLKVARMVSGSGKMVCSKHNADLLTSYLYGDKDTVSGGSFAATAFAKNPAAVGDILPLPGGKTNVSSLVITDSTGSPVTATLGTHYEISAGRSSIKILSLSGLTQPLKAAGTEAAGSQVNLLTTVPALKGLRFEGINKANNDAIVVIDLGKIQISPASSWGMLNDGNDVNKYEIDFEILEDGSNATYPFGRYKE
jgi:hypothetical protein